jgi:hypothetical protein
MRPNIRDAYNTVQKFVLEIRSPYNDGFSTVDLKRDLYEFKCWLDDQYTTLPTYVGEDKWEQERLVQILKR